VNRRDVIRRSALSAAGLVLGVREGMGQVPRQRDSSAGDPLFRPDLVQERAVASAADNDPVVKGVERRLKCTCGCNLDIYTCRTTDFTCTYSPQLHQEVLALHASGKSPDEVVTAFVAKYGEQVLMAPIPRGFNLAGYLVPGAAVTVAGATLAFFLLRRSRRLAEVAAATSAPPPATRDSASQEDSERLRRALSRVQD
jgi:cytochrome c-type biogenesis protein CcmH/NrfF